MGRGSSSPAPVSRRTPLAADRPPALPPGAPPRTPVRSRERPHQVPAEGPEPQPGRAHDLFRVRSQRSRQRWCVRHLDGRAHEPREPVRGAEPRVRRQQPGRRARRECEPRRRGALLLFRSRRQPAHAVAKHAKLQLRPGGGRHFDATGAPHRASARSLARLRAAGLLERRSGVAAFARSRSWCRYCERPVIAVLMHCP